MQQNSFQKKAGLIISILIVAVVIIVSIVFMKKPDIVADTTITDNSNTPQIPAPTPATTSVPTSAAVPGTTATASLYKNGTYSAVGSYRAPSGPEQITVSLTLVNDIVTEATVTGSSEEDTSQRYMDRFISGYKQYVIGKNIASIKLTRVSGSSLTPIGFDNALKQIEAQAKKA